MSWLRSSGHAGLGMSKNVLMMTTFITTLRQLMVLVCVMCKACKGKLDYCETDGSCSSGNKGVDLRRL